jgi:hypothetical protein
VLINIQTSKFLLSAYPETHKMFDHIEEQEPCDRTPRKHRDHSQCLRAKQLPTPSVEQTISRRSRREPILREKPQSKCSPRSTDSVNGYGTDGIVDVQFLINEYNCKDNDCAPRKSDPLLFSPMCSLRCSPSPSFLRLNWSCFILLTIKDEEEDSERPR